MAFDNDDEYAYYKHLLDGYDEKYDNEETATPGYLILGKAWFGGMERTLEKDEDKLILLDMARSLSKKKPAKHFAATDKLYQEERSKLLQAKTDVSECFEKHKTILVKDISFYLDRITMAPDLELKSSPTPGLVVDVNGLSEEDGLVVWELARCQSNHVYNRLKDDTQKLYDEAVLQFRADCTERQTEEVLESVAPPPKAKKARKSSSSSSK